MADALRAFEAELESKNFKGYWQNIQGDVYREPVPSFEPCHWKGKDLFAAMEKAKEVVGLDVSFRRVIQMWNPSLKNGTSRTLVLNLQLLKPGEDALSHRHMAGAIRFILKGHGTRLIVEGESFEIGEGDFVTTPSWTWHDHENHGGESMMWLDGLDSPLVRLLETDFHQPDPAKKQTVTKPDGYTLATVGALRPAWTKPNSIQPPAFCYKWADTERALSKVGEQPGDPYDGIVLDYANPLTGGPTCRQLPARSRCSGAEKRPKAIAIAARPFIMYGAVAVSALSAINATNGNRATPSSYRSGIFIITKIRPKIPRYFS